MTIVNVGAAENDGNGDPLRDAFRKLNTIHAVESRSTDAGSITPADGDLYIVPASATGDFSGQDDDFAWYNGDTPGWEFTSPTEGVEVWVKDVDQRWRFDGSAWVEISYGSSGYAPVKSESGTTYTFVAGDAGDFVRMTNSSAITVTIPPQSSVTWADDTEIFVEQAGDGKVQIAAGSGVTINIPAGLTAFSAFKNGVISLKRVASDEWTLGGALEPDHILDEQNSSVASASTVDMSTVDGDFVEITGTTTITSLGTVNAGIRKVVEFAGALTLTHNGTSLILPTSANITTVAGDTAEFVSLGSGNWKCLWYMRQAGTALA